MTEAEINELRKKLKEAGDKGLSAKQIRKELLWTPIDTLEDRGEVIGGYEHQKDKDREFWVYIYRLVKK